MIGNKRAQSVFGALAAAAMLACAAGVVVAGEKAVEVKHATHIKGTGGETQLTGWSFHSGPRTCYFHPGYTDYSAVSYAGGIGYYSAYGLGWGYNWPAYTYGPGYTFAASYPYGFPYGYPTTTYYGHPYYSGPAAYPYPYAYGAYYSPIGTYGYGYGYPYYTAYWGYAPFYGPVWGW